MFYVHANTKLMDKINDGDYKETNVQWMEMTNDMGTDSHNSN